MTQEDAMSRMYRRLGRKSSGVTRFHGIVVVENAFLKPGTAYFFEEERGVPYLVTYPGVTRSWRFRLKWWWMTVGLNPKNLAEKFRPR